MSLQEGSIGHDLVIRPIPDSMSAPALDDEAFMDPHSMADMVSIDTGLPIGKSANLIIVQQKNGEKLVKAPAFKYKKKYKISSLRKTLLVMY